MNPRQDRVLGRGLSALISGADRAGGSVGAGLGDREARLIALAAIGLNPDQPRKLFNDNTLQELSDSVRQVGVLQPVLVRRLKAGEAAPLRLAERLDPESAERAGPGGDVAKLEYCLVAGERRLRAASMAGIAEIPAIVCTYEETEALKVALLENIQREDLNPVEEATAFQQLLDGYGATQEELAVMLGKSRSGVANTLRLLALDQEILDMVRDDQLSRGHAKVLLGVVDPAARLRLARLCRTRGLSVRECEVRVRALLTGDAGGKAPRTRAKRGAAGESREIRALRERAEAALGSPVQIERGADAKGELTIRFYSDDDLLRILAVLGVDTDLS
jgi:ParB family chromosome partitioning protein